VTFTVSGGSETCIATLPATTCNLVLTGVGARTLTASYSGDARFATSSDTEAHTVNAGATTTAIVSHLPEPSNLGANVIVTIAVAPVSPATGTPGGTITVSASASESCTITLPATSCALALTTSGTRTLTASYGGDALFTASTTSVSHAVVAADLLFRDGYEDP